MKIVIDSKEKLNLAINDLKQLYDDNVCLNYSAVKSSKSKTKKQLAFIWEIITDILTPHYNSQGYNFTPDDVKNLLYVELSVNEPIHTPTGKLVYIYKGMSVMDVKEMTEFITQIINYIDNYTDCILPSWVRYSWINNLTENDIEALASINWESTHKSYLEYIRSQSCLICGKVGCDVHHIKDNSAGLGKKVEDYLVLPICHICHVKQSGHITNNEILQKTRNVLQGLDLTTFCKLNYARWYYQR